MSLNEHTVDSFVRRMRPSQGLGAVREFARPSGLWVPERFGNDARSASRRVLRPLAVGGLSALLACNGPSGGNGVPPLGPDPNGPSFECVGESAAEYGSGLPFDVSSYDSNAPGCFTVDEKHLVDVLTDVYDREVSGRDIDPGDETAITAGTLQGIVDRFVTVGPVIPNAVLLSYEAFVVDREFDPELEFDASTIGSLSLHQMLPVWSLPSRYADPGVSAPLITESPTDFPSNPHVERISGLDWSDPSDPDFLGFIKKFTGIEECNVGGRGILSSTIKMNLYRGFDSTSPVAPYELLWYEISLPTLPGAHVTVHDIFVERLSSIIDHERANITFREHIHPYDRTLVDTPWRDHRLSHTTWSKNPLLIQAGIPPPFAVGDEVTPSDVSLFVTPYMPAFLLDYILLVPENFGVGYGNDHFGMDEPIGPLRPNGYRAAEVLGAQFYPEGVQNRDVRPRYNQDNRIIAPCTSDSAEPSIR